MAAENFKVKKGLEVGTGITATSSGIDVTGIVTATTFSGAFSGDGSAITGVTASGSGVIVRHDGSNVGTAGTIDFSTNLDVSAVSAGIVTITATGGSTGISTVSGVVSVANDLDVDGHTELDNLNVAGVSTFTDDVHFHGYTGITSITYDKSASELRFQDNAKLKFGSGQDLHIYHSGGGSIIREQGTGDLTLTGQDIVIQNVTNGNTMGNFVAGGSVKLHYDGDRKFITTNEGVLVSGGTTTGTLSVSGLSTFTGNLDINADIDVDGETNLDDVVVAGVSTFNDGITLGTNSTTFAAKFANEAVANFGSNNNLQISHDNSNALIRNSTGKIIVVGVVSATSGADVTGVVTATTFSGAGTSLTNIPSAQLVGALPALDGSALTGVTASGSGVVVKHDGTTVGTAGTINFSTNLDVTAISAGIVTITASSGGSNASTFTVTANNSTDETVYPIFVDGTTGSQGAESDTNLSYNPNSNTLTAGTFSGAFSGNLTGAIQTAAQTNITSLGTLSSLTVSGNITGNGNIVGDNSTNISGIASVTATSFHGSGALLTSLNADNLGSGIIPNGRFPTTLPATSGANLTALNASEITSGTLPIARIADDAVTFAKMQNVGTGVLIGRNDAGSGDIETLTATEARTLLNVADGATVGITTAAWTVGHSGASYYTFTGPGGLSNTQNADIHLVRGQTYQFIVNASGHGFGIQTVSGTWTGSNAYTTGITNPGAAVGTITFRVPYSAPGRLYYACTSQHSGMVGNIYISGGGGVVTYEGAKELQLGNNTSSSVNTANLVTLDLGGTHHDTAGSTGKLKLWKDAIDEMSLGVSSNQMDFILTSGSYSYNFYGGNTGATRLMQLNQTGNIELALGNENSSGVTAPLSINLGGTYSSSAGNGNDLSAKLKVWCNGSDVMGFSVSGNQLDYIVTSESYDHVFYGGNAGTTELARFTGDGNFGIGTNDPSTALEVKGDITVYNSNNQGDIFFGEYGDVADSKALIRMDQVSGTAGELQFHTESGGTLTKRLTIDSSGRVQIGSSTDAARNTFNGIGRLNLQNNSQDGTVDFTQGIVFTNNASNEGTWTHGGIVCTGSTGYDGNMVFGTDGTDARDMSASTITEKMRLTADGCLLVGKSTVPQNSGGPDNTSSGTAAEFVYGHVNVGVEIRSTNGASNQKYLGFKYGGGPTDNGGIRRDGTTNNVEFYGGSDRRIKKNIQDMDNTLSKICQISLKKFDFKDGTGSGVGVIGQELINVFPEKVTKTDDGTGDTVPDGVEPWSVGHNYTYQILKAIQELKAENDSLKARIATLEGS